MMRKTEEPSALGANMSFLNRMTATVSDYIGQESDRLRRSSKDWGERIGGSLGDNSESGAGGAASVDTGATPAGGSGALERRRVERTRTTAIAKSRSEPQVQPISASTAVPTTAHPTHTTTTQASLASAPTSGLAATSIAPTRKQKQQPHPIDTISEEVDADGGNASPKFLTSGVGDSFADLPPLGSPAPSPLPSPASSYMTLPSLIPTATTPPTTATPTTRGSSGSAVRSRKTHSRMELLGAEAALNDVECEEELFGVDGSFEISKELDITNEELDFDELDELIDKFQQDERVQEALTQGVDLRAYSRKIEDDLRKAEEEAVLGYVAESHNFSKLHDELNTCDSILESMEKLLSGFQADLGNISEEIKYLQKESSSISVKLNNRRQLEEKVANFLEGVIIPKALVNGICALEVNEAYLAFVTELNKKIEFVEQARSTDPSHVPQAVTETEPHLLNLKHKAVAKIREFLLQRIYNLTKPKTNIQIFQETTFAKYRYFYVFLHTHAPEVAVEVHQSYVNTMSKIYTAHFATYIAALTKLCIPTLASRNDLIGVAEEKKGGGMGISFSGLFGGSSAAVAAAKSHQVSIFALGVRKEELDQMDNPIVPHVATQLKQRFSFEAIFKSYNQLLVDSITNEWKFYNDFFGDEVAQRRDVFGSIFGATIISCLESLDGYLGNCYDVIGLLLMLRITVQNRQLMSTTRRINIGGLDEYFRLLRRKFLDRYNILITANADSLDKADGAALCDEIKNKLSTPHYITRRYAEFSAAINELNRELANDTKIEVGLTQLRASIEGLLKRMVNYLSGDKNKCVFYINNYDVILSVLSTREITSVDKEKFLQAYERQIASYVALQLTTEFHAMLRYVTEYKDKAAKGQEPDPDDAREVGGIVADFSSRWQQVILHVSGEVMNLFSNFQTGSEILKQILSHIDTLYKDFGDIVRKYYKALAKDLVARPTLTYEIKKYTHSFD
eukprot:TRINITY_DN6547_c1_g1_i1.p1 TRINITY_DN6547_c1_g1~~TRINITY_DN6547_c1_g1_i1.p1  ORF type:complete len:966 (+),score=202.04 TRINITY_DN6547_c1_g1_i1:3-2900(+)